LLAKGRLNVQRKHLIESEVKGENQHYLTTIILVSVRNQKLKRMNVMGLPACAPAMESMETFEKEWHRAPV